MRDDVTKKACAVVSHIARCINISHSSLDRKVSVQAKTWTLSVSLSTEEECFWHRLLWFHERSAEDSLANCVFKTNEQCHFEIHMKNECFKSSKKIILSRDIAIAWRWLANVCVKYNTLSVSEKALLSHYSDFWIAKLMSFMINWLCWIYVLEHKLIDYVRELEKWMHLNYNKVLRIVILLFNMKNSDSKRLKQRFNINIVSCMLMRWEANNLRKYFQAMRNDLSV